MKKLCIILLAIMCMFMVSCNKNDNTNKPDISVDRTEPNTSSPETTKPETSSPETTNSPETTKPPVPATTVPEQAGEPVLLPTYEEVTDFKYHTYSFPYPIRYLFNQSGRYRFETRSQLVSFAESKEYLEKLDLKYWWGTQEPIPEKEQYEQQVTDAVSKLLDTYDEKFFEDTCLILTCYNVKWFTEIYQVLGAYKSEKKLEIDYSEYVATYSEEVADTMPKLHLVGLVLEIPKKYLLDETKLKINVATYPTETLDTLREYGVDSKEAAEIAENERIVRRLKGYIKYYSNFESHRKEVQMLEAFLEKYQK